MAEQPPVVWQALLQLAAVFGVLMAIGAGIWKLSALASRVGSHGHRLDEHDKELKELHRSAKSIDERFARMEERMLAMDKKLDRIIEHGCDWRAEAHNGRGARA